MWIALCVAFIAGLLGWSHLRAGRWRKEKERGLALLRRGDLDGAAAVWDGACKTEKGASLRDAQSLFAWVELRRGRPDRAIALFREADRPIGDTVPTGETELRIAQGLARTYALKGDIAAAEAWLERARKRVAKGHEHHIVFEELLLALRRGDREAMASRAASSWREIEASHTGEAMREIQVLRAFAAREIGETGRAATLVEAARTKQAGGYDWMAVFWPELGEFLSANGL